MTDPAMEQLYAPFRPRRGRRTAWGFAIAQFALFCVVALLVPADGPVAFRWYDRLGFVLVGLAVGWALTRFALVSAHPSPNALRVRNLVSTAEISWVEVLQVRYGNGRPWVLLELGDGDELAVMAIQRADGAFADAEAQRLATLVALHDSRPDLDLE